jgi:hypothetical protein
VQHEGISVSTEFGCDEEHALRHQAGNDIARAAVELGNQHRAFRLRGCGEGGGQLKPAIECIGSLAGFNLGELLKKDDASCFSKAFNRSTLCLNT